MVDQYKALVDNGTWHLVPQPPTANVVTDNWILKHKFHSDGTLGHHKGLVGASWFLQANGVDYEAFSQPPLFEHGHFLRLAYSSARHEK